MGLAQKLFGTHSEHELKRIYPIADKIEGYRESYSKLSDEELKGKTKEFKDRLAKGETLDDILPEAFATVREAGRRVLGMEHYRVQLIGGIILHQGRIAEMITAEKVRIVQDADFIYREEVDNAAAEYKKEHGEDPSWMPTSGDENFCKGR